MLKDAQRSVDDLSAICRATLPVSPLHLTGHLGGAGTLAMRADNVAVTVGRMLATAHKQGLDVGAAMSRVLAAYGSTDDTNVVSLAGARPAPVDAARAGMALQTLCHEASYNAGWWHHAGANMRDEVRSRTRLGLALTAEKICLAHSELSEGMEGVRKDLMDDKLPHRKMTEVELADAAIRIFDLAGALDYDLGAAIAEKMAFNAIRPDHKAEARAANGGKAF